MPVRLASYEITIRGPVGQAMRTLMSCAGRLGLEVVAVRMLTAAEWTAEWTALPSGAAIDEHAAAQPDVEVAGVEVTGTER